MQAKRVALAMGMVVLLVTGVVGRVGAQSIGEGPGVAIDEAEIPALVTRGDVVLIVSLAFAVCICASLIPALYASALSPAAALHEEN